MKKVGDQVQPDPIAQIGRHLAQEACNGIIAAVFKGERSRRRWPPGQYRKKVRQTVQEDASGFSAEFLSEAELLPVRLTH
jgi:hypothetical protein